MSSSEYVCPHCWKGQLQPLKRKQWPERDVSVRGWRKCDSCGEMAEVPAGLIFCAVTILLGLGMFVMFCNRLWEAVKDITSGQNVIQGILVLVVYGFGGVFVVRVIVAGARTWGYTRWYRMKLMENKAAR